MALHTRLAMARMAVAMAANMSRRSLHLTAMAASGGHGSHGGGHSGMDPHELPHEALNDGPAIAAGREYVGYFLNGEPSYSDRYDHPFPAIRFRKPDAEFRALREKEKGDWKKLSLEEKKKLYRYTFRATLAEFDHPTGYWKAITALTLAMLTFSMIMTTLSKKFLTRSDLWFFDEETKNKQLELMIRVYAEPVTGVASKWDYEKNVWKA